jgi:hypothetical protein
MADSLSGTKDEWGFVVRAVAGDGREFGRGVVIAPQLALVLEPTTSDIDVSLVVESFVGRRQTAGLPVGAMEGLVLLLLEDPLDASGFPGFADVQGEEACVAVDVRWSDAVASLIPGTARRASDDRSLDVTLQTSAGELEGGRGAPVLVSDRVAGLLEARGQDGQSYRAVSLAAFAALSEIAESLDQMAAKGAAENLASIFESLVPGARPVDLSGWSPDNEGASLGSDGSTTLDTGSGQIDDAVLMTVTAFHAVSVASEWALGQSTSGQPASTAMLVVLAALASPSRGGVVRELRRQLADASDPRSDGGALVGFALSSAGLSGDIEPLPTDQSRIASVSLVDPPGIMFAELIDRARSNASVFGLSELHRRHLLAAAVASLAPTDEAVLNALGVTQPELARLLFEALRQVVSREPAEQWARLLGVVAEDDTPLEGADAAEPSSVTESGPDEAPAPGADTPEPEVPAEQETAPRADVAYGVSVSSDFVAWDKNNPLVDHLGVDKYVTMLSDVAAAVSTPLPISIGLFGEWGTGKSYFMGLMQQEIQRLARRSREERGDVHCKHVVQVRFNAWHYAEANLWASLAAEIFLQLATAGDPDDAEEQRLAEERRKLLSELDSVREIKVDLENERRGLERTVADRQGELTKAEDALERARAEPYRIRAVIDAALETSDLAQEYAGTSKAVKDLGLRLGHTYEEFETVESELRDSTRGWKRWRQLGGRAGVLALAFIAMITVVLVLVPWSAFGRGVTGVLAVVGSVLAAVQLWASKINKAADRVDHVMQRSRDLTEDGPKTVRDRVAESVEDAREHVAALEQEEERASARIVEIGAALEGMESGERLRDFIAERNASNDYKETLGLVSYVRRDFDELTRRLNQRLDDQAARTDDTTSSADADEVEIDTVDRIVLYIDDLDRCSAPRVVKVLEAVHLLLALDLFVVVVGVDPRWLAQSLRVEYRGILELGDATEGDERFWQATPQNYLEKIFQIPFVLPGMDAISAGSFVESLGVPTASRRSRRQSEEAFSMSEEPSPPDSAPADGFVEPIDPTDHAEVGREDEGEASADVAGPIAVEPASPLAELLQNITPSAERFELAPREEAFMKLLTPMVETPRAIKRMFNIYRMLRGTTTEQKFVDTGEYQVLAVLLAILTGYPSRFADLYSGANPTQRARRLYLRDTDVSAWPAFVDGLKPRARRGPAGRHRTTGRTPRPSGSELPALPEHWQNDVAFFDGDASFTEWAELHRQLKMIEPSLNSTDITPYKIWAPSVCRFSFELSPVTIR